MKKILSLIFLSIGIISLAQKPNYSQKSCWLLLGENNKKKFDVFFVYPTTYMNDKDGMNARLDNKEANKGAESAYQRQATVFKEMCNVYAPRYRQASIKVLSIPEKDRDKYLNIGLEDVHEAFKYYLKHHNNGRPYIIAGHSQGSQIIRSLLLKYNLLVDKKKLVAVYAVGYTFTTEHLKKIGLPLAVKAEQTGGLITWNTVGENGKSPVVNPGALCVNPLSWSDSHVEQAKSKDLYARILLKDGKFLKIPHFTSARIDKRGTLVIPTPAIIKELSMGMGPEVYHGYDYDFFYGNLVKNVAKRCKAWQNKNSLEKVSLTPNYSQKSSWLNLEQKASKDFDVFYVHPTTYHDLKDGINADINNVEVNKGAAKAFDRQATVFSKSCNIYAPRYRQLSRAFVKTATPEKCYKRLEFAIADIQNSFKYYLKHYNKGRPFILAGHSQGSTVILEFLRKYSSRIDKKKLIAVYMIGTTVNSNDLKEIALPLAKYPEQLGGVITWNTIGKGGKCPALTPGALCVNPLNWTNSNVVQPKSKDIYARILLKNAKIVQIPNFTSARINKDGGLVIPTPSIVNKLSMGMGANVYHEYDYGFFYGNIAENVATRCKAWQDKNK